MNDNDDTIRKGKQASEDTQRAMLRAGLMPGVEHVGDMNSLADLDRANDKVAAMGEKALMFYEIERGAVEQGKRTAAASFLVLQQFPANIQGSIMLTFEGWADDPREVFQVPQIRKWAKALLFGTSVRSNYVRAKRVLASLVDESALSDEMIVHGTGGMFLVRIVFAERCYSRSPSGGWLIDLDTNLTIYEALTAGRRPK